MQYTTAMAKGSYEIEIKSLLGAEENAQRFKYDLAKRYGDRLRYTSFSKQLNHYFEGGKLEKLTVLVAAHLAPAARKQLKQIATKVQGVSVRTRLINDEVRLVIKASLGTDSSANGVARMEFEEPVKLTLAELDKILIKAGFKYQAKWSRVREEFEVEGISVCLDKNAGYGHLIEFERVIGDTAGVKSATNDLKKFMRSLGAVELAQDRLERMFAYYNKHWPRYYGTDKVFTIK